MMNEMRKQMQDKKQEDNPEEQQRMIEEYSQKYKNYKAYQPYLYMIGGFSCALLYMGLKDYHQKYKEIFKKVSKDPRVQEISQKMIKSDEGHQFKVVTKKGETLTFADLEQLIIPITKDTVETPYSQVMCDLAAVTAGLCSILPITLLAHGAKQKVVTLAMYPLIGLVSVPVFYFTEFRRLFLLPALEYKHSEAYQGFDVGAGGFTTQDPFGNSFVEKDSSSGKKTGKEGKAVSDFIKIMTKSEYSSFLETYKAEQREKEMEKRAADRAARSISSSSSSSSGSTQYVVEESKYFKSSPSSSSSSSSSSSYSYSSSFPTHVSADSKPEVKFESRSDPYPRRERIPYQHEKQHMDKFSSSSDKTSSFTPEKPKRTVSDIDYEINKLELKKMEMRRRELEKEFKSK